MTNKFFEIKSVGKSVSSDADLLALKFLGIHEEKVKSIKTLCGRVPEEGEIFFLWAESSFNAFSFIPFVIRECGVIDELIISTYTITSKVLDSLCRLMDDGKIKQVVLFVSDSIKFRMPVVADKLNVLTDCRSDLKVCFGWNHSKISLMKVADKHFVVEGSGNWSDNAKFEQYIFLNSREAFEFRNKCVMDEFNRGSI